MRIKQRQLSPQNEFIQQDRIRRSLERQMISRLRRLFQKIGTEAARQYRQTQTISGLRGNIEEALYASLRREYRQTISIFGERILSSQKQETLFEKLTQQYIQLIGLKNITRISETTFRQIQRVISFGLEEELGIDEIAALITESQSGAFALARSATIARTEVHGASTFANDEITRSLELPGQRKRWVAANDARTRDAHIAVSGTEVGMDENFVVGGVPMKYPGDPAGGAANVINCRCVVQYTFGDEIFT